MAKKTSKKEVEAEILKLNKGLLTVYIVGSSPLIYNRMSEKVQQGLLQPRKKTKAERDSTLKHDPPEEYRNSMYTTPAGPTLLCFPAVAFKRAMASAAIDVGVAKRTQMDRLVWAVGERISIYGLPKLRMDVVRCMDINKTPDIRTRAIVEDWACSITLAYVEPAVTSKSVANLLAAAGMIRGIGDFRQEKGAGNFGQFELVSKTDKRYAKIVKEGGRKAQQACFGSPECYDGDTEDLYQWWHEEVERLGRKGQAAA